MAFKLNPLSRTLRPSTRLSTQQVTLVHEPETAIKLTIAPIKPQPGNQCLISPVKRVNITGSNLLPNVIVCARKKKHGDTIPVVKPAVDVTGSNSTADGRVRTLEKIRLAGDIAKRVGAGWVLDCEKENKWYTVDSTTFPRGGGRKSMEPHTLSNNKGSTNGRRSGADWETMEEFMRLSTNTSSNSSLDPHHLNSTTEKHQPPRTPTKTRYNYCFNSIGMSPSTPYYLSQGAKSIQKMCPGLTAEFPLPLIPRPRSFSSSSRLEDADGVKAAYDGMKRSRIGNSGLVVNGKLTYFKTRGANFRWLLQRKGQAYFDRTRFISVLDTFDQPILFLRPRRFGKSLTVDMLEHFHGLQFKDEHGSLYQGLDVQRDISKGKATPGKYFILKLDFSRVSRSGQPETDFQALNDFLNLSIEKFYKTYAKYLGDFTDLKREIHNDPNISLGRCVLLVQETLSEAWKRGNSDLTDVQGIYLLVDEYDCFSSDYLEPFRTGIPLDIRFKSFFSAVKSMLMLPGGIQKVFMTGISPLSLTHVGSGFNVAVNLSFTKRVAALCGLTGNDIEMALKEVCGENSEIYQKHLSIMTKSFNGFYFCRQLGAETVYNSETCLDYLQRLLDGDIPEAKEPPNSEVSIQFLNKFSTSGGAINDLEEALKCDERGNFKPFKYGELKQDFMVEDLNRVAEKSQPAWRSLMISFGGLTFCPEDPANYLRIPNSVAARRIAEVVLEKYGLRFSLNATLDTLVSKGHIQPVLSAYRDLMVHRDVGYSDYNKSEETHRDSFYFALLKNASLRPQAEFPLTLPSSGKSGRVDLILPLRRHLVVTEWKVIRIDYLDIKVPSRKAKARHGRDLSRQAKASILNTYMCDDVLGLKFSKIDTTGRGGKTIRQWIEDDVSPKLRDYISAEVRRKLKEGLLLRAHLVVIVGSRHILMWDVDDDGELTNEPYLVHEEFR